MKPEIVELIQYRLARAQEALEEAKLLLEHGHLPAAVNRLYYACFYAVTALLLAEDLSSLKHSGVMALFDRHWILTERIPKEMGRLYRRLFDRRQKSDYGDMVVFAKEDVETWMKESAQFVSVIAEKLKEKLGS